MPAITDREEARKLIARRHPEHLESVETHQWLLDTLEGGERYKDAFYGVDRYGRLVRNLYRQKREGVGEFARPRDPFGNPLQLPPSEDERELRKVAEDDFESRRLRTPVPRFMTDYVERQLSKIYKRPINRDLPDSLKEWIDNIDGRKTSLQEWMHDTVGPLLSALGLIDIAFDHPMRDDAEPMLFADTLADWRKRCIAWYILPTNIYWWKLDYTKRYYLELLVREYDVDEEGCKVEHVRHWTTEDWTIYEADGKVHDHSKHPYGVVPVVRLFDRRNLRTDNLSSSRMWGIADLSRQYYNEESELVANQSLHNCPLMQGPADDQPAQPGTVPIGRGFMLTKVIDRNGNQVGYEFVSPPTESAKFMTDRLNHLQERMDQQAALTRPIGTSGTKGKSSIVGQSGLSKAYDQQEGSEYLASIAKVLEVAEYTIVYFALGVLHDGFANVPPGDIEKITIVYPKEFNLLSFDQFALIVQTEQAYIQGGLGHVPTDEKMTLKQFARMKFPDATPDNLDVIDAEIDKLVDAAVESKQLSLAGPPSVASGQAPGAGAAANGRAAAGPSGQSPVNNSDPTAKQLNVIPDLMNMGAGVTL